MSLINIGLTGLKAHQTALTVTGNNVTNTNTEGYSRQEVVIKSNPSQLTGAGYVGAGATVETVRRVAEEFLTSQIRSDTTVFNERDAVLSQAQQIDDLLASNTTGLTPALSSFFQALQGAADDPTSVPQRQLLLTQAEGLVARFSSLNTRLTDQVNFIDQEIEGGVSTINSLAQSIASLNTSITTAIGAGQGDQPNSLLDERDEALRKLSEVVSVSVTSQNDGQINVFMGNGQPLVVSNRATLVVSTPDPTDGTRLDIGLVQNGITQIITDDLNGGKLGGLVSFRESNLDSAINSLGRIAMVLSDTINEQHQKGMDLESNLGGLFFADVNDTATARSRVQASGNNLPPNDQVLRVNVDDPLAISADDYILQFNGPSAFDVTIKRKSDDAVVSQSLIPSTLPAKINIDGFEIVLESGTFKVGDEFAIRPTRTGARDISLQIDRVEAVALASPIRADSAIGNTGSAEISLGTMLDVKNPLTDQILPTFATPGQLTPPMEVRFITDSVYEVLDMTDPANPVPLSPPLNSQRYIAGLANPIFASDPGQTIVSASGTSLSVLPAAVASPGPFNNGYGTQDVTVLARDTTTGLVTTNTVTIPANASTQTIENALGAIAGVQANAYSQARLNNFTDDGAGSPLGLTINGEVISVASGTTFGPDSVATEINNSANLKALGIYAISDGNNLDIKSSIGVDIQVEVTGTGDSVQVNKVNPYTGTTVASQVVTSGNGLAVGGYIDLKLSDGVTVTSNVGTIFQQAPVQGFAYTGFQFEIQGEPKAGDKFTIGYNSNGISDNRNAQALAALETQGQVANGVNTYGEAYSQIVEQIGTTTNRARLDSESAKALLQQSEDNRSSISGVSLDEEAGKLVQFQAAYNASAQVVSIARQIFDTLLSTFR